MLQAQRQPLLLRLPTGRTRVISDSYGNGIDGLLAVLERQEGLPPRAVRLVGCGVELRAGCPDDRLLRAGSMLDVRLVLAGGGGDGDQPDWTERGKISAGGKRRGPEARAPDWHADPAKYAAKMERDKRERGELVVAVGPFCVPCGKRFAKQSVFDAHLSGKKHLAALQRMGRDEEAMVCQLDIEAKKRKADVLDEARRQEAIGARDSSQAAKAEEEEEATRRAEREEKLRQRQMIAMPACVTATSVYTENQPEQSAEFPAADASGDGGGGELSTAAGPGEPDDSAAAAVAAIRAEEERKAAARAEHRKLANPSAEWFNPVTFGGSTAASAGIETQAPVPE